MTGIRTIDQLIEGLEIRAMGRSPRVSDAYEQAVELAKELKIRLDYNISRDRELIEHVYQKLIATELSCGCQAINRIDDLISDINKHLEKNP